MTIKAVLSDLGNVVGMFEHKGFIEKFSEFSSVSQAAASVKAAGGQRLLDSLERHMWNLVAEFELGHMDPREFRRRVSHGFGFKRTMRKDTVNRLFSNIFTLNEEVAALWQKLRQEQDITLVAVSNLCVLHERGMRKIGALEPFDHIMLSHEEELRKPSTELIIRALDRAGVAAEEAVFVDDRPENLVPAKRLGVKIHCFNGDFKALCTFLTDCGLKFKIDEE